MRAVFSLLLCGLLTACGQGPAGTSDDYFPLQEGRRWTYRTATTLDDHPAAIEMLTIHNRAAETMGDAPAVRRHTSTGTDYWLRSDKTGITRIASRNPLDRFAQADEPVRYVLQRPYQVGTQWQVLTTAYMLQRRSEVPKEIRRTHKPFPMVYTIEALDDKVETRAGNFERCLRLGGSAKVRLYVDAQFAWRDIPLTSREWYCPGVGLVKLERDEPSPSRFMLGGKLSMELVRWE